MIINPISSLRPCVNIIDEARTKTDFYQENLDKELKLACESLNLEEVASLIKRGANPSIDIVLDAKSHTKTVLLSKDEAVVSDFLENLLFFLLQEFPELVKSFTESLCALDISSERPFSEIVFEMKEIVENTVFSQITDDELNDSSWPPEAVSLLHIALFIRDLNLVKILIDKGVNPSREDLEEACVVELFTFSKKSEELAEYLFEKGFSLEMFFQENYQVEYLMQDAVNYDNKDLADFLEKHGVSRAVKEDGEYSSFGLGERPFIRLMSECKKWLEAYKRLGAA
ncbi:MAG: hypothetical protein S4CHLAM6_07280 [Chlamydiae bacterium]|nr:hypothetical protein [Chlamydiota bacterium]